MSKIKLTTVATFLFVSLLLVMPKDVDASASLLSPTLQDAHAYIDAGTFALLIQFLIAGVVGGLFLIKVFWTKVKAFFVNFSSLFRKRNG